MRRPGWLQDPAASSLLVFAGLIVIGFVAIGIGDRSIARTLFVDVQVPALVSGGMGGLALILLGCGLCNVQAGRRLAAAERAEAELLLDEASLLVEAFKRGRT
jgi:parvulin-like peptidyl-prolyl isomerase